MQIIKEGWFLLWIITSVKSGNGWRHLWHAYLYLFYLTRKLKFHVHTNASNFAPRAMLSQNPNKTINRPIYYANRLMNNVKMNYITIEKEVLAMIYAMKKLKKNLFRNNFTFLMDHQALLYLVNKPIVIGWIARWLLLLQWFDFKIIFKLGWVQFLLDQF